ncbi:MAG TPA: hypothetical protein VGM14_02425 [Streptosporangiaceae bacterium]
MSRARAHDGLGSSYQAADDHGRARQHWQEALAIYSDLRAPEAAEIRERLSANP